MVLKEIQDPLLLLCDSRIKQKWLNLQGIDLTDCLQLGIH